MRFSLVLIALVSVLVACGGDGGNERSGATIATTLLPFVGVWDGHLRTLTIPPNGHAREEIFTDSFSGNVVVYLEFRVAHRHGTAQAAKAQATVTDVDLVNRKWFTKAHPPPYVGERGTISLRKTAIYQGVTPRLRNKAIYEGLTGVYYCYSSTWSRPRLCRASFPRPRRTR